MMMMVFVLLYILCISHNITPAQRPDESKQFFSCQSMTQARPAQPLPTWFSDDDDYTQQFAGMEPLHLDPAIPPNHRSYTTATLPDTAFSEETLDDPQKLNALLRRPQQAQLYQEPLTPTQQHKKAKQSPIQTTPQPATTPTIIKKNNSMDEFDIVQEDFGTLIRERLKEKNQHIQIPTIQYLHSTLHHTPILEGMTQEQFVKYIPLTTLFLLHNNQDYTDLNSYSLPEQDFQKFLGVLYNNDSRTEDLRTKEIRLIQQWKHNKHPFMSMRQMQLVSTVQHAQSRLADATSTIYTALANLVRK